MAMTTTIKDLWYQTQFDALMRRITTGAYTRGFGDPQYERDKLAAYNMLPKFSPTRRERNYQRLLPWLTGIAIIG